MAGAAATGAAFSFAPFVKRAVGQNKTFIMGTNWKAQAEHGGYYQAVAAGIYKEYGLDVEVRSGGPQVNHAQLLLAGKIDFNMGSNTSALNFVANDIPYICIASIFQKDPQILMAHPGQGVDSLADMKGRKVLISNDARTGYWLWLKQAYGFTDDMIEPYTFNPAPFIADKSKVQQGYLTSEPLAIEREGGFVPRVFLLADNGYNAYSTTIECSKKLVAEEADAVQRFVDATIIGWVRVSARRQPRGQRPDQERQPGYERRAARLFDGQVEGVRDRRVGRCRKARRRRHDRRTVEELLRLHGQGRHSQAGSGLQAGLHAGLRQQGRRPEDLTTAGAG